MASDVADASRSPGSETGYMTSEALDPVDLFLAYSFSEDAVYQQGVESIVASGAFEGKSEEERAMLVRSSQVFYFNRAAGSSITVDDVVQRERQRRPTTNVVNGNAPPTDLAAEPSQQSLAPEDEPRTLSFAELKALIEQGKTDQIPNNRQIPDELNQAPPSQSTASVLKKPWETRQ